MISGIGWNLVHLFFKGQGKGMDKAEADAEEDAPAEALPKRRGIEAPLIRSGWQALSLMPLESCRLSRELGVELYCVDWEAPGRSRFS